MSLLFSKKTSKFFPHLALSSLLVVFLFSSTPRQASAQFVSPDAPANIWTSIVTYADSVYQSVIKPAGEWAWEHGAATAFRNMAKSFTQQIAYNAAVQLASGGTGQTPLFTWKGLGDTLQDAADDALGDAIDNFTKNGLGGFSLCDSGPDMPEFKLIIGMYLFDEADVRPKKANCSFSKLKANINRLSTDPRYKDQFLKNFGAQFDPKQNQLGMTLDIRQNILKNKEDKKKLALEGEKINQGFKSITEPITGFIKSPAQSLKADREFTMSQIYNEPLQFTGDILADALGVFTQTFAARFQKRLLEGVVPSPSKLSSKRFGGGPGGSPSGVDYAVQVNTSISTVSLTSGDTLDIISEFSNCTQNPEIAPVNNCTIDSKMAQALRSADEGKPLTVQEAIDKGLLNGSWGFKELRPAGERTPTAWYLSDLKKLRKARIIPVGWELAAEEIINSDSTEKTLQQMMGSKEQNYSNGFNGVGTDGKCGTADIVVDQESPYCGLIDPNWLLKAPASQCRLQGFGQQLEPLSGSRAQTCVDVQNCVSEKTDGTCQAWGYCTREKNIWRLGGDSCEFPENSGYSPFASCQTYSSREGDTVSYLADSVNTGGCTADTFGCRGYATKVNTESSVTEATRYLESGTPNVTDLEVNVSKIYLRNQENYSCDSNDEGCRQFLRLTKINPDALSSSSTANPVEQIVSRVVNSNSETYEQHAQVQALHLKSAPAYLNCYNVYTAANATADHPIGSFKTDDDSPECKNYLAICKESEVGCDMYAPKAGGPTVPAVAKSEDVCPNECVGFNTYNQLYSHFNPYATVKDVGGVKVGDAKNIDQNFIPATGQKCSAAEVGCAEFTNIVAGERKEYYSYVRSCIKPDEKVGNDLKAHTYYTWVGSENTGYQLKTWLLEASDPVSSQDSAPKIVGDGACAADGNPDGVDDGDSFPTANPDCKQFYTTTGQVSYRLASKTITADSSCTEYRKTVADDVALEQVNCLANSGKWKPDASGQNACYYNFIQSEAKSCSARAVSCREYKGPTADNVKLVFPMSTFGDREPGVESDLTPNGGWSGGEQVSESVGAFGRSYKTGGIVSILSKDVTGKLLSNKQYVLNFWARKSGSNGTINLNSWFHNVSGSVDVTFSSINNVGVDWQVYSVGPVELSSNWNNEGQISLLIEGSSGFYIDNIQLKEISDTFYVVKDSWRTPNSCYAEYTDGTPNLSYPRELRCSAYTNRAKQTLAVKSFSSLCRAEAAGCEALVDTRNSSSPRGEEVVKDNQTVTTPDDQVVYRVYDVKKSCAAQAKSCTRLGKPDGYNSEGVVNKWADEFLRVDPDTFSSSSGNSPLCSGTSDRCEKYTFENSSGNTQDKYFKDPGEDVCEYKQSAGSVGYAWYKKGTTEVCPDLTTKLCPSDQSSCTEFKDPVKQNSYYYLNNKKLDRTSCGSQVSEVQGCLLFNDTSNSSLNWSAAASYSKSKDSDNKLVSPLKQCSQLVDNKLKYCTTNEDCSLVGAGTCINVDSNTVIKVRRDRVCSEWLACQSETTRFMGNKPRTVCQALGKCNQWGESGVGKCSSWVNPDTSPKPLNSTEYQKRIVRGTIEPDYSGYSIPNLYPLDVLGEKNYSDGIKLTYSNKICEGGTDSGEICSKNSDCNSSKCVNNDLGVDGVNTKEDKLCRAYPAADSPYQAVEVVISDSGWKSSCIDDQSNIACTYAEDKIDVKLAQDKKQAYKDASVCQQGENCECFYKKANYSSGDTLYYGFEGSPPSYFRTTHPDNPQTNSKLKKQDTLIGLRGYCLEKDPSRLVVAGDKEDGACLTWYPSDTVTGDISIYDYNANAGFSGDKYYCARATGQSGVTTYAEQNYNGCTTIAHGVRIGLPQTGNWGNNSAIGLSKSQIVQVKVKIGRYLPNNDCRNGGDIPNNSAELILNNNNDWSNGNEFNFLSGTELVTQSDFGSCPETNTEAGNYWATRAVFDSNNNFTGVNIGICQGQSESDGTYSGFTIEVKQRNLCTEVIATSVGEENKAWTNRLLGNSNFAITPDNSQDNTGFSKDRTLAPFGSFNVSPPNGSAVVISDKSGSLSDNTVTITTPYACEKDCSSNGVCVAGKVGDSCANSNECDSVANDNTGVCSVYLNGVCSNNSSKICTNDAQCSGGTCVYKKINASGVNSTSGFDKIKQLFSKIISKRNWSGLVWSDPINDLTYDVSGSTLNNPAAPEIRQVVYNSKRQPSEGAAGFTLQSSSSVKQSGDFTVNSPAAVSAQFYAYNPNGEQMPLREVWVDWGDGKKSGASGKYKNHKNICQPEKIKTDKVCGLTSWSGGAPRLPDSIIGKACVSDTDCNNQPGACTEKLCITNDNALYFACGASLSRINAIQEDWRGDNACRRTTSESIISGSCKSVNGLSNPSYNFGDSTQACQADSPTGEGYFNFTHVYTCTNGSIGWVAARNQCEFMPKVLVQDNWGWCLGRPEDYDYNTKEPSVGEWDTNYGTGKCDKIDSSKSGWFTFPGKVTIQPKR